MKKFVIKFLQGIILFGGMFIIVSYPNEQRFLIAVLAFIGVCFISYHLPLIVEADE